MHTYVLPSVYTYHRHILYMYIDILFYINCNSIQQVLAAGEYHGASQVEVKFGLANCLFRKVNKAQENLF